MKVVQMSTVSEDSYILVPDSVNQNSQGGGFVIYRDFKVLGLRFVVNDYLAGNSRMELLVLYVIQLCIENIIQIQP